MKYFILVLFVAVSQEQQQDKSFEILAVDQRDNNNKSTHNFKRPLKFNRLAEDEKREIYHYEQTIVIRDAGLDNKVHRCELIEVYKERESEKVADGLGALLGLKVQKVDMEKIMSLLNDCDSVDELEESNNIMNEFFSIDWKIPSYSFTNGIYPGTKWCGFGDVASSYHDLAEHRNLDRCCRAHDFCPIKVLSYDRRYNLTNIAIHAKSHCLCDEAFYNCLRKENSWTANFLGHLYFYAVSPECLKGLPEISADKMEFVPASKTWYK